VQRHVSRIMRAKHRSGAAGKRSRAQNLAIAFSEARKLCGKKKKK
jgi:hypothetical protein